MLEGILLDINGRPRVKFSDGSQIILPRQTEDGSRSIEHESSEEIVQPESLSNQLNDEILGQNPDTLLAARNGELQIDPELDLQGVVRPLHPDLPSTNILLQVVDFFCRSFHHWIPFLHKRQWRQQVEHQELSNSDLIVLHAAVAVTLPHLRRRNSQLLIDQESLGARSRTIVLQTAMTHMTLQSTQALIILIFDNVGEWIRRNAKHN